MNILAKFTLKENIFILNVTKKKKYLFHLLIPEPLSYFLTSQKQSLCIRKIILSSYSHRAWIIRKVKPILLCTPNIRISPPVALLFCFSIRQPSLNS